MTDYKANIREDSNRINMSYVSSLLRDVFFVPKPILPDATVPSFLYMPYPGVELESAKEEYDDAPIRFGNKTWGAFWLKGGSYKCYDYNGELKSYKYSDFLMPLASLVDFSRAKVMQETAINGGVGSVAEIYSMGDWDISINGIIVPDKENQPSFRTVSGQQDAIQRFDEIAGSVEVEGQIFAKRDISRIRIKSVSFRSIQGKPHMLQYQMSAKSDSNILITSGL